MNFPDSMTMRCPVCGAEHEMAVTYAVKATGSTITVGVDTDASTAVADHVATKHFKIEVSDGHKSTPPALHHQWIAIAATDLERMGVRDASTLRICKGCFTPRTEDTILTDCDATNRKHTMVKEVEISGATVLECLFCKQLDGYQNATCPGPGATLRATILESEAVNA